MSDPQPARIRDERFTMDGSTGEIMPTQQQMPEVSRPTNMIFASSECAQVFGALAEAQGEITNPQRTKTASVRGRTRDGREFDYTYKYAPLDEIHNVMRGPIAKAGLGHTQFLAQRGGAWVMRTIIYHRSGEWIGCDYPIFPGRQEGAQGFASGVTYARRYGLMLALGIAAEDDDDANVADANSAQISERPQTQGATRKARTPPPPTRGNGEPPPEPEGDETQLKNIVVKLNALIKNSATPQELSERWNDERGDYTILETSGQRGRAAAQALRDLYNKKMDQLEAFPA